MVKMRALQAAFPGGSLIDAVLAENEGSVPCIKRVQFDVHESLKDRLDTLCGLLSFSRREFMEAALIDALDLADRTFFGTYQDVTGVDFAEAREGTKRVMLTGVEV